MATILRKQQWGNSDITSYEVRKTAKYIHLAVLTRETGRYDIVYRLPLSVEQELLKAYDSDTIADWVFRNIDEYTDVVSKEKVL